MDTTDHNIYVDHDDKPIWIVYFFLKIKPNWCTDITRKARPEEQKQKSYKSALFGCYLQNESEIRQFGGGGGID